jgi:hypothetical protein
MFLSIVVVESEKGSGGGEFPAQRKIFVAGVITTFRSDAKEENLSLSVTSSRYVKLCTHTLIVLQSTVLIVYYKGHYSAHWQVLHWCNVVDVEKAGSRPSAECPPVPEKWNSQ